MRLDLIDKPIYCELVIAADISNNTKAGERGAADVERDVRDFAMRFCTKEDDWDLVGNNSS